MNEPIPVGEIFDFSTSLEERDDQRLPILYDAHKGLAVGTKLYAIPSTHRVVSVDLLKRIEADVSPFSHYALKEELRAIIDNKE